MVSRWPTLLMPILLRSSCNRAINASPTISLSDERLLDQCKAHVISRITKEPAGGLKGQEASLGKGSQHLPHLPPMAGPPRLPRQGVRDQPTYEYIRVLLQADGADEVGALL